MSSIDTNALFKIEYGLYVVTLKGEELDNGLILHQPLRLYGQSFRQLNSRDRK